MKAEPDLQHELDCYEDQLSEIAGILLDDRLTSEQKVEDIEAVVFPEEAAEE